MRAQICWRFCLLLLILSLLSAAALAGKKSKKIKNSSPDTPSKDKSRTDGDKSTKHAPTIETSTGVNPKMKALHNRQNRKKDKKAPDPVPDILPEIKVEILELQVQPTKAGNPRGHDITQCASTGGARLHDNCTLPAGQSDALKEIEKNVTSLWAQVTSLSQPVHIHVHGGRVSSPARHGGCKGGCHGDRSHKAGQHPAHKPCHHSSRDKKKRHSRSHRSQTSPGKRDHSVRGDKSNQTHHHHNTTSSHDGHHHHSHGGRSHSHKGHRHHSHKSHPHSHGGRSHSQKSHPPSHRGRSHSHGHHNQSRDGHDHSQSKHQDHRLERGQGRHNNSHEDHGHKHGHRSHSTHHRQGHGHGSPAKGHGHRRGHSYGEGRGHSTHVHIHVTIDDKPDRPAQVLKQPDPHVEAPTEKEVLHARCDIRNDNEAQHVDGYVLLRQREAILEVKVNITVLPVISPGEPTPPTDTSLHGFHVHQFGDFSKGCLSFGAHYNPEGAAHHGGLDHSERHVGDWANIEFNEQGVAVSYFSVADATLRGPHSLIGRGIVVHGQADDLGEGQTAASKASGNAGGRLACCIIGWAQPITDEVWPGSQT